ncbi:cryptochrome/photolyase family protein [Hydrogenophaga borbori]|uniref:Cryptochrome/photolyase family protein n=1 Tax=Hydrogenophaga borbori TaxID=2294117 RepID=A0A372EGC1_9BURK|nr:cryptochrome/photolyase family protein [Hydrogenophaga borbori]RFP77338.1 cryptochrome/photolyase family protein [Hydrogenophaga borbori]
MSPPCRHLVVVLGDQLDPQSSAFDGFDATRDRVWMCEAAEESTHVWSSQQRIVQFLAAMRHFAAALRERGLPIDYQTLREGGLADALGEAVARWRPQRVRLTWPGDWRVLQALRLAVGDTPLDLLEDRHFFCSTERFARHARGRRSLRLESFYREMRREHGVLMDGDGPCGGVWNLDGENRAAFGAQGPGFLPPPARFEPDALTAEVIALVRARFGDHPGQAEPFGWPVTRAQALQAMRQFIDERLAHFGHWQDAMWGGEPWLYHAQLSAALNLKLLHPRELVAAAEGAWRAGRVPLASAEGFIRQILGWREYVRGVYWLKMPAYADHNALDARRALPAWYWSGDTPMRCLSDAIGQTLRHGYAHHIQRLMVTGLFALLYGVEPKQVHAWYLSVYVDAVEWVELPNTLGMSQYADGGLLASKPYIATGRYIERMSDHCRGCRFDPGQRTGERACPFTTLYWDFLVRHAARFAAHPRLAPQLRHLDRIGPEERAAIAARAAWVRAGGLG